MYKIVSDPERLFSVSFTSQVHAGNTLHLHNACFHLNQIRLNVFFFCLLLANYTRIIYCMFSCNSVQ